MSNIITILLPAATGIIGTIIGAFTSYFLQRKMESKRNIKEHEALKTVLINEIKDILALISDEDKLLKYKYITNTQWKHLKFEFAKVSCTEEWLLFNSFYAQCDEWNYFLNDATFDTDLTEAIKPLENIAHRIFQRHK